MADCNSLFDEIAGESRDLLNEIATSPDRAAAITAAAVLSDLLYLILSARMLKDDKIWTRLWVARLFLSRFGSTYAMASA